MPVATVVFTGIVLLQPMNNLLKASMPDASQARSSVNVLSNGSKFLIPPHVAYVMVRDSQVFGTSRQPDLRLVRNGDRMNVYFIQGPETFEVASDSTDPVKLSTVAGNGGREPFRPNVVETHQLRAQAALVNAPKLAGIVNMKHGLLFAGNLDTHDWTFVNSDLGGTRHQAESVIVDFNVTINQIDLTSSMGGGKSIHLTDGVNAPIVVEFGNGTLLAVLGACPLTSTALICDEGANERFDFHYEVYAMLFNGSYLKNGKPPVPRSNVVHHPTGSNCPPQFFE